jgi:23S rRNA (pseudouridine1915-N3)-methyltransferase
MKIVLLCPSQFKENWFVEAAQHYETKIKTVFSFEFAQLKSKTFPREKFRLKLESEEQKILQFLKPTDKLILLDEKGQRLSSQALAEKLAKFQNSLPNQTRIIFLVGGAYGVSETIKQKNFLSLRLSDFTLAHPIALLLIMEQLYRAGTLIKKIPYHNG